MLVISNHVKKIGMKIPKNAVVRINIAWLNDLKELRSIINENKNNEVWVDYPTGRKKPPTPKILWIDAVKILNVYKNVKYFAFSNAEDCGNVWNIRKQVPKRIKLIPKIETVEGVRNLANIVKSAETDTIMFDKEDLYTDVGHDPKYFEIFVDYVNKICKENKIKCLGLKGVIFSD
jgi:hypothetical protein